MLRFSFLTKISVVLTVFMLGCSSVGSLTSPDPEALSNTDPTKLSGNIPIGVTEFHHDGSPASGTGTLGLFQLHLDADNLTGELISMRQGMLPDVLEVVDITNFLQLAPCTDCVKLYSVSLDDDGNLVVSIGIKHPFEQRDPYSPIYMPQRSDLHVFNVEGIVVSSNTSIAFPELKRSVADFRLLNASGYTGYLNSAINDFYSTSATIHPYILHFDDYSEGNFHPDNPKGFESVVVPPPSGNLVMAIGSDYDFKDYVFDIPDGSMNFIYAVGCTYGISAKSKAHRLYPEYRIPQFNKKAASEVWVDIVENNLISEDAESSAILQINVVDINHGVPVGDALNEMLADSSVSGVSVEIPGVTIGSIDFSTTPISGTGHDPSDPLVFEGEITNAAAGSDGSYIGLVKVIDSYPPGINTFEGLNNMDGIKRVDPIANPLEGLFLIDEFATYQVFSIKVEEAITNQSPIAILAPESPEIYQYQRIEFDATASYDPDGTIDLYEFDFDWDRNELNFSADVTNTTGIALSPSYDEPSTYYAGLRVTDNLGAVDYTSVEVTVNPCGDTIVSFNMDLPDMSRGRRFPSTIVINDQLWIMGGVNTDTIEVFDLETETWLTTPREPIPSGRTYFGVAHYEGKIYCQGGMIGSARTSSQAVYDIATNTWDLTHPDFPGPKRNVCRSVVYNDEIYLAYGLDNVDGSAVTYNSLDIYDPNTRTWRQGANAPYGRSNPVWVVVGDKIWAMGNNNPHLPGFDKIEYYDPATDEWTSISETMSRHRGSPGYIAVGEKIFLVGGQLNHNVTSHPWIDVFDTVTRTWTEQMDLPENRGYDPGVAYYKCKLYAASGGGDNMSILRSIRSANFE